MSKKEGRPGAQNGNKARSDFVPLPSGSDDLGEPVVSRPALGSGGPGDEATRSASPSTAEPTGTSEPSSPIGRVSPRPSAAAQLRDPERYLIIGEHGRGGLGRVSRAHDLDLGRDVAIKELISRGNVSEIRFLREALITARLEHPGIVPVHEAGRWPDGTPFYAMKLVAGRPLRDLIAERTTVAERIGLLHHVIAVADAIAYAHGRNIIHRDLKPANVIVGDFGETIVIDWGLAKDLSTTDDATIGGGPFRANRDNDLTVAGSVLGTPAYMAPEQERGEHVDQRADVFAIGAMLWELCSLQKVPPADPRLRHRMLRRAGIDSDLITIIDKSLDPEPKRRYPDAGALASDLKAFKSGARIAGRSYSLVALLAHWTRRHRTLAVAVATAVILASASTVTYVRNITLARDRADASQVDAQGARAAAQSSLDELTLKHAQLLLATDPSATIDMLASYTGAHTNRINQLRAEAAGRGIARLRAAPHTNTTLWARADSTGTIVSLSADGTIAHTSLAGRSVAVSQDVARIGLSAYTPARHLLAYACNPANICIRDIRQHSPTTIAPVLRDSHAVGLAFSPNGTRIATMSQDAVLNVFDIKDLKAPLALLTKAIPGGNDVKFLDEDVIVAGTRGRLFFVHTSGRSESIDAPDNSFWDADSNRRRFAVSDTKGGAVILEGSPIRVIARATLCQGTPIGLQFVPKRNSIAYACREGNIGIWDIERGTSILKAQLDRNATIMTVSDTGDHIVAGGGNGTVTVLDLRTDLVASYKGHESRITALTAPTSEYPFAVSGDARGSIRVWALPETYGKVVATSISGFHTAIFGTDNTIIAAALEPALTTYSTLAGPARLTPHEPYNVYLEQSDSRETFAAYGLNDIIELWSWTSLTRLRTLHTNHGSVSQLSFIPETNDIVTAGNDGRLLRWDPTGKRTEITRLPQAISAFTLIPHTDDIVLAAANGSLWRTDLQGNTSPLESSGSAVTRLVALRHHHTIFRAHKDGTVIAMDTKSWQSTVIWSGSGSVQDLSITPDGQVIALTAGDGSVHVGTRSDDAFSSGWYWGVLDVRARHQTLTTDGILVIATTGGAIWIYSTHSQRWLYLPTGSADFRRITLNADASTAVALDLGGKLIWLDLNTARELLHGAASH
jgi:WD40 repeat protein